MAAGVQLSWLEAAARKHAVHLKISFSQANVPSASLLSSLLWLRDPPYATAPHARDGAGKGEEGGYALPGMWILKNEVLVRILVQP